MKVFEIFSSEPAEPKIDFDLADDVIYFMNNDPEFYRKDYFPFLNKFKHHCNKGNQVSAKAFVPIVKKGFDSYIKRFPVEGLDEKLSSHQIRDICEKLQSRELKQYHDEKQKDKKEK